MTNTMKAVVLKAPRECDVREVPVPSPGAGEVRVRLEGCGVCASNLPPWEGRPWFEYPMSPGQLGHEGWGRIDALGSGVRHLREGQRVAMLSDHAYAEYDTTPADRIVPLPEEMEAQPFPGEPLGCAVNVFRRSGVEFGQTVAVVGVGFLGALLVRLCHNAGARVIAISRRPFSQETARRMQADDVVAMDDHWRIIEEVRDLTGGDLCDVVIEAVGKQWPLDLAGELVRQRGRLVIAGYHQDGPRQVNMQSWNWNGLDVVNAHEREMSVYIRGIREAMEMVHAGQIDPRPLLTHTFPLDRLGEALDATNERPEGFMKAMVFPGAA